VTKTAEMQSYIGIFFLVISTTCSALEMSTHGIGDIRLTYADTNKSYLDAGHGKFANNNGTSLSLAQLGAQTNINFNTQLSAKLIFNGYYQAEDSAFGITEAYLKYKSLPSSSGWRIESRNGIFYPKISLENEAFAWASINTLNSSMINTWIGEEIRLTGSELKFSHLGKHSNQSFDYSITTSAFVNNDPSSALLSWHGWTTSSQQSIQGSSLGFPEPDAAKPGGPLADQAKRSKPFDEIDDDLGYLVQLDINKHQLGKFNLGFYDNRAKSYLVTDGQYGWGTRFVYGGAKFKLNNGYQLTAQYLKGDNLMQSPARVDIVKNDYHSGFIMLSKRHNKNRYSIRIEEFQVVDKDHTTGDDNNEYGKALTLNYSYRYSKPLFFSSELNIVKSKRAARAYHGLSIDQTERQIQIAARYFF